MELLTIYLIGLPFVFYMGAKQLQLDMFRENRSALLEDWAIVGLQTIIWPLGLLIVATVWIIHLLKKVDWQSIWNKAKAAATAIRSQM